MNLCIEKIERLIWKSALILCVLPLAFYSNYSFAQSEIKSLNIVADDDYPPYIFRNDKGELQGIIVDQWKLWEAKTGVHPNIIAMDWGKAYKYMLEGNADVIETIFESEERDKIFDFSKPYAQIDVPIFFHKSLSGISDLKTLRGFTVGVKSGDNCINIFNQNGITTLKEYPNYETIIKAAASGEVRVFCIDKPPALYHLYKNNLENDFNLSFIVYSNDFHRAVKKGNTKLLNLIESGFAAIPAEEKEAIEKRWLGTNLSGPSYLQYAGYIALFVLVVVLLLITFNFFLRHKVKEKTKELNAAKEKAEEMNRLKSSFLANMSHELRTPMIGILGYSEILSEDKDPNIRKTAAVINQSGHRLMDTLNLILNLSRIEAGNIELTLKNVDLVKVVRECCQTFEQPAFKKSLKLKFTANYSTLVVHLDEMLLKEIIKNLLSNAIKYTDSGCVTVEVDSDNTNSTKRAFITVKDTGIGIAKEHLPFIWDEFRQVSEGFDRSFEGTGLGLSITKKFVEKMNGTITMESELNAGSAVTISFPVILSEINKLPKQLMNEVKEEIKPPSVPPKKKPGDPPAVLFVEDDPIAVMFVGKALHNICLLDSAKNSDEAIAKVSKKRYAAILMDINLGRGVDGLATTKIIRQIDAYKNVPIVAVTAYAMVGDKEEFLKAGCDHYLSKPFGREEIVQMVSGLLK